MDKSTRSAAHRKYCLALTIVSALGIPVAATHAQEARRSQGDAEFYFSVPYTESLSERFVGNTTINTDSEYGFGVGFDWALSERWSVGGSLAFTEFDVNVDLALAEPIGSRQLLNGEFDATSIMGNITRHFGRGPLSPYAFGGVGFVYVDTNVPDGPAALGPCWWDPWWGYSCGVYQETKTSTEFSYGIGVGLRWDLGERMFVDLSVAEQWVSFDNAVDLVDLTTTKIAFGFRM